MQKIYNHNGKVICLVDPSNGFVEIKTKHFTQRQTLMPGMSIYYDDEDGYTTIIEYIGPYEMYHNSYKRT